MFLVIFRWVEEGETLVHSYFIRHGLEIVDDFSVRIWRIRVLQSYFYLLFVEKWLFFVGTGNWIDCLFAIMEVVRRIDEVGFITTWIWVLLGMQFMDFIWLFLLMIWSVCQWNVVVFVCYWGRTCFWTVFFLFFIGLVIVWYSLALFFDTAVKDVERNSFVALDGAIDISKGTEGELSFSFWV